MSSLLQHPALQSELWRLWSSPQHGASVPYLFVQFKSLALIPLPRQMAAEKNGTFRNRLVEDMRHLAAHTEGPKRPSRILLRPVPLGGPRCSSSGPVCVQVNALLSGVFCHPPHLLPEQKLQQCCSSDVPHISSQPIIACS